jgi:hypothetical protein
MPAFTALVALDLAPTGTDRTWPVTALVRAADRFAAAAAIAAAGTPQLGDGRPLTGADVSAAVWPDDRAAASDRVRYKSWALGLGLAAAQWAELGALRAQVAGRVAAA